MTRLLPALTLLLLLCAPSAATAAAPDCPPDGEFGPGPTMGIGPEHVLGGVPERASAAGGIVVREGRHTPRTVTLARVPGGYAPTPGDRFGAALATGILERRDSCADIVAGAPGRSGTGAAYLLLGSTGALPRAATEIRAPDGAPGDEFGAAVAVSSDVTTFGHDLWIGAPGRDVAGQADAGAIYRFKLGEMGEVVFAGVLTQGTPLMPDTPEAGDRLGELLAPVTGGVVAGLPHEDIGALRDAGAIEQIRVAADGSGLPGGFADQSAGGLETPEAGDRFGAAVYGDFRLLAGAPGEDIAGRADAGLIAEYELKQDETSAPARLRPRRTYRQGARGVQGRAEAGDRFGAALATGASLRCQEDSAIAVGVPGEDFRGLRNAGAVALLQLDPGIGCRSRELIQGRGLPGRAHSRERTGTTLGIAPDRPGLDEDTYDTLLVGVPSGEILATNAAFRRGHRTRLTAPPGAPGYGSVFALPAS